MKRCELFLQFCISRRFKNHQAMTWLRPPTQAKFLLWENASAFPFQLLHFPNLFHRTHRRPRRLISKRRRRRTSASLKQLRLSLDASSYLFRSHVVAILAVIGIYTYYRGLLSVLRVVFKPKATTAKEDRKKNQFMIEETGEIHAQICGPLHQAVCMRKHDLQS